MGGIAQRIRCDELIVNILVNTNTSLVLSGGSAPVTPLFETVERGMTALADALKNDSWKLGYLRLRIEAVMGEVQKAKHDTNLKKSFLLITKQVQSVVHNVFRLLHPSPRGQFFIREGTHPLIEKHRVFILENKPTAGEFWELVSTEMRSKDRAAGVAALVATNNCFKLVPPQMDEIWDWAEKNSHWEVLGAVLNTFWVPPQKVARVVAAAMAQKQFDQRLAEPVIVHHFDYLGSPQQAEVQRWIQQNNRSPIVQEKLDRLAIQLRSFLIEKGFGVTVIPPAAKRLDLLIKTSISQIEVGFGFLVEKTVWDTNDLLLGAQSSWAALKPRIEAGEFSQDVLEEIQIVADLFTAFITTIESENPSGSALAAVHNSYGSMDSNPISRFEIKVRRAFSALKQACEDDNPEAVALDCFGFYLLEEKQIQDLLTILLSKKEGRVLPSLFSLEPFVYLDPEKLWVIFKSLIEHKRYAEAERMMDFPHFRYVGDKVSKIALDSEAPATLRTRITDYRPIDDDDKVQMMGTLRFLAGCLTQALINNGWLKIKLPPLEINADLQPLIARADDLFGRIPKDAGSSFVVLARDGLWPVLKQTLESTGRSSISKLLTIIEAIYEFRKPIVGEVELYETKSDGGELHGAALMASIIQDLKDAIREKNLRSIQGQVDALTQNKQHLTLEIATEVGTLIRSIPHGELHALFWREGGFRAIPESVRGQIDALYQKCDNLLILVTASQDPLVEISADMELISHLREAIQSRSWDLGRELIGGFIQRQTTILPATIILIQVLIRETPLQDMNEVIGALVS